jgi:hypothetical protein
MTMSKRVRLDTQAVRWPEHGGRIEVAVFDKDAGDTNFRFFSAWLTKGEARRLRDQLNEALHHK